MDRLTGHAPLHTAVLSDNIEAVELLLWSENLEVDKRTQSKEHGKMTALQIATINGQNDIVQILLENGANPNLYYDLFRAPTAMAITRRDIVTVGKLLDYGAELEVNMQLFNSGKLVCDLFKNSRTTIDFLTELICSYKRNTYIREKVLSAVTLRRVNKQVVKQQHCAIGLSPIKYPLWMLAKEAIFRDRCEILQLILEDDWMFDVHLKDVHRELLYLAMETCENCTRIIINVDPKIGVRMKSLDTLKYCTTRHIEVLNLLYNADVIHNMFHKMCLAINLQGNAKVYVSSEIYDLLLKFQSNPRSLKNISVLKIRDSLRNVHQQHHLLPLPKPLKEEVTFSNE